MDDEKLPDGMDEDDLPIVVPIGDSSEEPDKLGYEEGLEKFLIGSLKIGHSDEIEMANQIHGDHDFDIVIPIGVGMGDIGHREFEDCSREEMYAVGYINGLKEVEKAYERGYDDAFNEGLDFD